MKNYKIAILILCFVIVLAGCSKQSINNEISNKESKYIKYVILNTSGTPEDVKSVIKKHQDKRGYILITDDKNHYISVFYGKKPNVGYPIIVSSVDLKGDITYVTVKEGQPKEGVKTPNIETSPLCSIQLNKNDVTNKFKVITEKGDELLKLN